MCQPPGYRADIFAELRFFHGVDYDTAFFSPWAMRFRKTQEPSPRVIAAYCCASRGKSMPYGMSPSPPLNWSRRINLTWLPRDRMPSATLVAEWDQLPARLASIEGRIRRKLLNRIWCW